MTATKKPPRLVRSELTGRVYVVTRYSGPDESGAISAHEKYDVTEQFDALAVAAPRPPEGEPTDGQP